MQLQVPINWKVFWKAAIKLGGAVSLVSIALSAINLSMFFWTSGYAQRHFVLIQDAVSEAAYAISLLCFGSMLILLPVVLQAPRKN